MLLLIWGRPYQQHPKLAHTRPTVTAAVDTSASVIAPMPLSAHCSPRDAHTAAQLWPAAPRCHCGATVAVADADTPCVRLDVGVVLAVLVGESVGLLLGVCDAVEEALRVLVGVADAVAVVDALAPSVRLPVGVYDACGQKHSGCQP